MPRRSWLSDGPLVAFSVGHRWATWPTYPWNRCRSKGGVAHGERPLCHAWPTHPDGAFGAVRAVHEASPHSIMGALVAPPGRQVRHGPAHIRRSRGPGFLWRTPPEARSRSYAWAASDMLSRPLGGTASAAPAPAQWSVALACSPLRRTGRQTPERACGSLPVQRLKKRRNWLSGSPINEEIGPLRVQ